jgi:hypothetical protein
LPYHNLNIDKIEKLTKVDFDLFPHFMQTEELNQLKHISSNNKRYLKNNPQEIYGNYNWILWLMTNWIGVDNIRSNDSSYKNLLCLLSGHPFDMSFANMTSEDIL